MRLHPHLHCVIPAGGFDPGYPHWVHPRYAFFLPVKVLSRVFLGKYLALLQQALRQRRIDCPSTLVRALLKDDWVVCAKPAFGELTRVLRYFGRYTHRVAISNQRLLSFDGHRVRFRWKDYAHGNKQRIMTLTASEFLRRFCQHVLPKGFVRIRHFGYLANARRAALIALARQQLASKTPPRPHLSSSTPATWRCPRCGASMNIGPTSPRNNWLSDASFQTLPDSNSIRWLSNVRSHGFAHPRPEYTAANIQPVPAHARFTT